MNVSRDKLEMFCLELVDIKNTDEGKFRRCFLVGYYFDL